MTTLTEFLLARITDDEGQAQRQVRRVKAARDADVYLWPRGSLLVADSETTAVFIGAWRVLAECEAKRRIIELHHRSGVTCPRCSLGAEDGEVVFERDPCDTLRALALPYADHPDYQQEWKP